MRYREFPYMQFAKKLEHRLAGAPGPIVNMAGNQPAAPSLQELAIDLGTADLRWKAPYTPPDIKSKLAEHYGVSPDMVMAVPGGSSFANFLLAALVLRPGDEVIVETPVYDALPGVAELYGCVVRYVTRAWESNYDVEMDALRSLVTFGTRLILLTNPHNPSGIELSDDRMRDLADFSAETGIPILVDEVYLDHVPDRPAAAAYGPGLIHTGSITKVYGLGTWRFGWLIAESDIVRRAERVYDLMGVSQPTVVTWFAQQLLPRLGAMRAKIRKLYDNRNAMVDRFVRENSLFWVRPRYCPFGFIRLPEGMEGGALASRLLEDRGLAVAPGHFFYSPGWLRLGWTEPEETVARGLEILAGGLRERL
jgi:aspartate/methionine/tyrosine aminotransferase